MNNFLKGLYILLYYKIEKQNGFYITYELYKKESKINLIFHKNKKRNSSNFQRKSQVLTDIEIEYKNNFDISETVQTIEMTKELCEKLAEILNIKLKFYDSEESYHEEHHHHHNNNNSNEEKKNNLFAITIPFFYYKEEDTNYTIDEISPQQKLTTLSAINRQFSISATLFINNNNNFNNNLNNTKMSNFNNNNQKNNLNFTSNNIFNKNFLKLSLVQIYIEKM